jgi:hypothetical protein
MVAAVILLITCAIACRLAVRRCPLARAIGRQIDQVAASSR